MGSAVKVGDLIEILKENHWGGKSRSGVYGIIINRTYLSYDSKNIRWNVFIENDRLIEVSQKRMIHLVKNIESPLAINRKLNSSCKSVYDI
tara:strand:- start:547 stop:819 length:273 start_codon:yes stop_codon:yes gene_type:complete